MDAAVSQQDYLKITRMYLNIVGIWPDQKKSNQYFIRILIYIVMISFMVGKILHLIYFFNMDLLMDQLCGFIVASMALIKHCVHIIKSSEFKVLLDGMIKDLETDKTTEELAVMTPYMDRALFMGTAYAYGAICCMLIFFQMPLFPIIADIIMPLNTSRPREFFFPIYYYFVSLEDSYYWTILHVDIAVIVTACGSIACDTFYICTVQHACGLFAVAGYRFKDAVGDLPDVRKMAEISNETYRKVCRSIMAHDRAIRHVREIDDFYDYLLFIAIGVTVTAFSSTLFWLSKLKLSEQFYVHVTFLIIELFHIFFLTIQGQFVINKTDNVYNQICEGPWYNSVPKTQALFILALRSAMDPPQITAGGLVAMNLQTFAEVVKLSFSYYTVLQSV